MEHPAKTVQLSVIIVNYNVQYFLEQLLLSVRRAVQGMEVEIFVVDNNSVDDSVALVQQKFPEVRLITNHHNPGFAIANNQALCESTGKYVLLLNPDTVVQEDTFRKCYAFMEAHPKAGGLGVRMIDGSGKFLPESKRGFPTPWVAFCKTFGLSRLFPRSPLFNRYHLGYLDEYETNPVDVLSGAFMWMRRSVLDRVGVLDEAFFMYGEDIDLSYRITQAGYENYYFPETTIIHYKGESTKKGSLNYVRVFYQAMLIFARKHFEGRQGRLFVSMLKVAIYLRALVTLLANGLRRAVLPAIDALLMFAGLVVMKNFWAIYHFGDPAYYRPDFLYVNAPLYIGIWVLSIYLSGGYDRTMTGWRIVRGVLAGSLLIAAVYGFLDMNYRSSRALIVLGTIWTLISTLLVRMLLHYRRYGELTVGVARPRNLVIAGERSEAERALQLLHQAGVQPNYIGTVAPPAFHSEPEYYLSHLDQLDEVVAIYRVDELIFCSKNIPAHQIMRWMSRLGPGVDYKIIPEESLSIIGSSSKNAAGELYTIDIRFRIVQPEQRRFKWLLDRSLALFLVMTLPVQMLIVRQPWGLVQNLWAVLLGRKSWVGYAPVDPSSRQELPSILPGVLSPVDALSSRSLRSATIRRLNFLYAKDYLLSRDWEVIWRGYRELGRKPQHPDNAIPASALHKSTHYQSK